MILRACLVTGCRELGAEDMLMSSMCRLVGLSRTTLYGCVRVPDKKIGLHEGHVWSCG